MGEAKESGLDVTLESLERIRAMADVLWQATTGDEAQEIPLKSIRHYAGTIISLADKGLEGVNAEVEGSLKAAGPLLSGPKVVSK